MPRKQKISAVEDLAEKYASQYFGRELLDYFGIEKKIRRAAPTEFVRLEVKQMYEDFNFEMEDGEWLHLEFESDRITREDMRRFREYEAVTSRAHRVPVVTYVICSANIKKPMENIREGINIYRVKTFRFRNGNAERLFERLQKKKPEERTQEDLLEAVFSPLYGGKMAQKERIRAGMALIREGCPGLNEERSRQMTAVLYFLATKFLEEKEMDELKKTIGMNPLGKLYYDDGIRDGKEAGRQLGMQEGIQIGDKTGFIRAFCLMVKEGIVGLEEAAKQTNLSVEEFREKLQE